MPPEAIHASRFDKDLQVERDANKRLAFHLRKSFVTRSFSTSLVCILMARLVFHVGFCLVQLRASSGEHGIASASRAGESRMREMPCKGKPHGESDSRSTGSRDAALFA